ncbi:MAG: cytochrome c biogenesis protein CcsA [Candidatus Acidiferrales bacterium]
MAGKYEGGAFMQGVRSFAISALICGAAYAAFFIAPTERTMGDIQRIFYFHMGAFINAFAAFTVAFLANIFYLKKRSPKADWLGVSGVEVAVAFTSAGLLMGPLWAKPIWGIYWTWDARLTSTFILWVLGVCYLLLRSLIEDPERRGVISAVFSIFVYLDVPLVYLSNRLFRTHHPQPVIFGGSNSGLAPGMGMPLLFSFIALFVLMVALMRERYRLEELRYEVAEIRAEAESARAASN